MPGANHTPQAPAEKLKTTQTHAIFIILAAKTYEAAEAMAARGAGMVLPACKAAILRLQLLCSNRRKAGKLLGNGFPLPATPRSGFPPQMD